MSAVSGFVPEFAADSQRWRVYHAQLATEHGSPLLFVPTVAHIPGATYVGG
jgi:hypothetical protein